jgi:hypothetical protein
MELLFGKGHYKGAKGPEGKSRWQELKANFETFEMLCPGIPEKAVKSFSVIKGDPQDNEISLIRMIKIFAANLIHWGFLDAF